MSATIIDVGVILDRKLDSILKEFEEEEWKLDPADNKLIEYFRYSLPTDDTRLKINYLRAMQQIRLNYF